MVTNIDIELPRLHSGQVAAQDLPGRMRAIRCGRRWGKTKFGTIVACKAAIKGEMIGWFAPDYRRIIEPRAEIFRVLRPVQSSSSKTEGQIRTISGGGVDFWTLNDELAGRGREYHGVIIDEAAFAGPNMLDIYQLAIRPTLVRHRGWALVMSNTNGVDEVQFFYKIINEKNEDGSSKYGFVEYHAPSHDNPYLPKEELEELERSEHPDVFRQEYLAEFVDWSGAAFFMLETLLENGEPVMWPAHCDAIFATIDTAVKTGKENDGTGVIYWAYNKYVGHPLVILGWELIQIEGSLLEVWLPEVFTRMEEMAQACRARAGAVGAWIEDKASGMILIQQAQRRGMKAHAIDSKLSSVGKDERAISVSGYVHRGMVKFSRDAYDHVSSYKGTTRNHLRGQVVGYRPGDKELRDDDLLDCFAYGIAMSLGNIEGF